MGPFHISEYFNLFLFINRILFIPGRLTNFPLAQLSYPSPMRHHIENTGRPVGDVASQLIFECYLGVSGLGCH